MKGPFSIAIVLIIAMTLPGQFTPAMVDPGDILKSFSFRALGPARQCGRILTVAVDPRRTSTFFVAPATGGLWKTENNGTTFTTLFPGQSMMPIGHIALAPGNPDIVWVGSGDAASGRTNLRGQGVFKSLDGGKTWQCMGLQETTHIGRIAIDPRDPDTVWVAAVGKHFSANTERGLYRSRDGGKTWERPFFLSDRVGVVDVALDPKNPDTLFAATYDKWRKPWHFEGWGPQSGIHRSRDAGKTWTRLTSGLPTGKIGRIGLAIHPQKTGIAYAVIDNYNPWQAPPSKPGEKTEKPRRPNRMGAEVYRTGDGGDTWRKTHDDMTFLGGDKWYGQIYVDPTDAETVYVPYVMLYRSRDGGRTWGAKEPESIAKGIHVDHHALWIDPRDPGHLILGHDGGLAVTWDGGANWDAFTHLPLAQVYAVGADMEEPYNLYCGMQDNGSVRIPSNGPRGFVGPDEWRDVGGGDGMVNLVDPTDSRWLYNASQFGDIQRFDQKTGAATEIKPRRPQGQQPLRFNWTTPMIVSAHNPNTIYIGAQVLLASFDRGDHWREISLDLTGNDPKKRGNIEYATLTTIAESPRSPGLIWTGSDDGRVQLTRNGGGSWTDCTPALAKAGAPADYRVSRIAAGNHVDGTAYACKTGFDRDDYRPMVYKTTDFGATWNSITANLPEGQVYVLAEDRRNPDLLFLGAEAGLFSSLDGGRSWQRLGCDLPANPLVTDLLVHPRENDLVVATHGRGLFVTDISPLQELNAKVMAEPVFLCAIRPRILWPARWAMSDEFAGQRRYSCPNEPEGMTAWFWLQKAGPAELRIEDILGREVDGKAGLNKAYWNMRMPEVKKGEEPPYAPAGEYRVVLAAAGKTLTQRALLRSMPER